MRVVGKKYLQQASLRCVIIAFLIASLAGCHRMYFHNGPELTVMPSKDFFSSDGWHHEMAIELVELSDPVDLRLMCEGRDWKTVSVQRTFVNGLIGGITWGIYGQWTADQQCS